MLGVTEKVISPRVAPVVPPAAISYPSVLNVRPVALRVWLAGIVTIPGVPVKIATLASAQAFVLTLDAAQREMLSAAAALDKNDTGQAAIKAATAALARLEQLLAELKPDEGSPMEPPQDPPGENGGQNQGNPPTLQNLAELKLLKLMQETINQRTAELDELRQKTGALTPEQDQEVDLLAQEQGQLADRVLEMIRAAAEQPEDDLENLPIPGDKKAGDADNKKEVPPPDEAKEKPLDEDLLRELDKDQ